MRSEISQGQDSRASTKFFFLRPVEGGAGGGESIGASGTRITWKEYEPYSFGTGTLIRFRRWRTIVSIGDMAKSSLKGVGSTAECRAMGKDSRKGAAVPDQNDWATFDPATCQAGRRRVKWSIQVLF